MFALVVYFIHRQPCQGCMATAITGSFYLTETVALPIAAPGGTRVTGTLDLSAYVNVPTGQAIAIESVDFIYQDGSDYSSSVALMLAGNGALTVQLTDLNSGNAFVRADNQSLVASGALNIDTANSIGTHTSDLYPDNFGAAAQSESFMVVNDTLYLIAGNSVSAIAGSVVYVSVRIRCRVVKLSNKDWIAIAIQSTAEA
jgi:hypothetical protein